MVVSDVLSTRERRFSQVYWLQVSGPTCIHEYNVGAVNDFSSIHLPDRSSYIKPSSVTVLPSIPRTSFSAFIFITSLLVTFVFLGVHRHPD